jgi:hypothetical protein
MLAGSELDTQHNTSLVRLCTTALLHSGFGDKLDTERNGSLRPTPLGTKTCTVRTASVQA